MLCTPPRRIFTFHKVSPGGAAASFTTAFTKNGLNIGYETVSREPCHAPPLQRRSVRLPGLYIPRKLSDRRRASALAAGDRARAVRAVPPLGGQRRAELSGRVARRP